VLLLTAETYSKFLHPKDKSVRTIFGDAASATLIEAVDREESSLGPYVFGTDGRGGDKLIVPTGGVREPRSAESAVEAEDESGNVRTRDSLFMDGPEIFNFTLSVVPKCVSALLAKSGLTPDDIALFFFHQANAYMLEHLRKRLKIPTERFPVTMSQCGNTVSSTIPIALKQALDGGRIRPGDRLMLVGFGVGYSWGAVLVRWPSA
jgi:3-oxoacyl-[acyl-carrier-protein] synthase III